MSSNPPTPDADDFSILRYWPALVVGSFIASGIISVTSDADTRLLFWLPPALVVAWLLIKVIFRPRAKRAMTDHRQLEREAWERYLNYGKAKPEAETAAAAGPATEAVTAEAAGPAEPVSTTIEPVAAPFAEGQDVVILWGTETGNAEGLAEMAAGRLRDKGLEAKSMDIGKVQPGMLCNISQLLIITSTWGDGEPPSNAIEMHEALKNKQIDLSKVKFSVLGLGDTSYPQFCQCAKDFDAYLEKHGASRIHPRQDCDLDYEGNFNSWFEGVAGKLGKAAVPA